MVEEMENALEYLRAMVALGADYKEARWNAAIIFGVDSHDLGKAFESQEEK